MIAAVSFALLVAIAIGYVLAPLIRPATPAESVCPACGSRLAEEMNFCAACGRASTN